ncbi:heparin lyase I family protein [Oceaniglobus trochenteri]|uniref:heparin lyase I family protein n=1 Tax=Oceaniglobus trochenteri TaxID=2763260 RepID=UPI001CFFD49F|nr:heparin lyase I family protein [Oceaniglobus trochenteri]
MMHGLKPRISVAALLLALAGCSGLGVATNSLPRGHDLLFSPHAHAFRFVTPPEPVRRGKRGERYELRDGDCGGSDCSNPRYRSEIISKEPVGRVGHDAWYGWSFRNGTIPSFSERNALRLVLGQWKLSGTAPPAFRLVQIGLDEGNWQRCDPTVCRPTNDRRADVVIQLVDVSRHLGWTRQQNDGHICRLFSMADARSQWMDIVVNTNFSAGPDGYLRAWVNDVQKCDYRGPVVATFGDGVGDRATVRRGIFASFTERWDASEGARPKPTMVAYYDEFSVGTTREDVDLRLREGSGAPAVD